MRSVFRSRSCIVVVKVIIVVDNVIQSEESVTSPLYDSLDLIFVCVVLFAKLREPCLHVRILPSRDSPGRRHGSYTI